MSQHYQMSFIGMEDNVLYRFDFLASEAQVAPLIEAITSSPWIMNYPEEITDFQLYAPLDAPTSLGALVEQISDRMDLYDEELNQALEDLRQQAAEIDSRAEGVTGAKVAELEFVWNSGGADDNAFTQHFLVAPEDLPVLEQLQTRFELLLENEVYALSVQPAIDPQSLLPLGAVAGDITQKMRELNPASFQGLIAPLEALARSYEHQQALEEQTAPAPQLPRPRM